MFSDFECSLSPREISRENKKKNVIQDHAPTGENITKFNFILQV